jgi:hypothetical protein
MPLAEQKSSWQRPTVPSRPAWRAPNPAMRLSSDPEEHRRQRRKQQTGGSLLASKPGSILASAEVRRCYRKKDGKRHAYWALVESYPRRFSLNQKSYTDQPTAEVRLAVTAEIYIPRGYKNRHLGQVTSVVKKR